jgi:hypothetical protein
VVRGLKEEQRIHNLNISGPRSISCKMVYEIELIYTTVVSAFHQNTECCHLIFSLLLPFECGTLLFVHYDTLHCRPQLPSSMGDLELILTQPFS